MDPGQMLARHSNDAHPSWARQGEFRGRGGWRQRAPGKAHAEGRWPADRAVVGAARARANSLAPPTTHSSTMWGCARETLMTRCRFGCGVGAGAMSVRARTLPVTECMVSRGAQKGIDTDGLAPQRCAHPPHAAGLCHAAHTQRE